MPPLPGGDSNDRSSADVSQPREDYAVVAKEMAKTQSLAASFRNISHYLSLIERARNTIQGVEAKLTELDDTVSEAAGLIDSDDYKTVSAGAIAGASIDGLASGSGTFTSISPKLQMEMGLGRHLRFTPTAMAITKLLISMLVATGYAVDDEITIAGTELGGSTSRNDATITVTDISSLNETTTRS